MGFGEDYQSVKNILEKAQVEKGETSYMREVLNLGFSKLEDDGKRVWPYGICVSTYVKRYEKSGVELILEEETRDRDKTFTLRPDGIRIELKLIRGDGVLNKSDFSWIEKARLSEREY